MRADTLDGCHAPHARYAINIPSCVVHPHTHTGQEFSGYKSQLIACERRLVRGFPDLLELAIGGTAVGTGLNTHPKFGDGTAAQIADRTGLEFKCAANRFAASSGVWLQLSLSSLFSFSLFLF